MRPNQVMFIYKSQLKDVKSRKETTLQISARNTNSRKIAANTVFSVLGNSNVQRGLLKIRVMACGSECRRFESVRAPQEKSPVIREIAGLLHFQCMRFYVIGLTNIQVTMFLEAVPSLE